MSLSYQKRSAGGIDRSGGLIDRTASNIFLCLNVNVNQAVGKEVEIPSISFERKQVNLDCLGSAEYRLVRVIRKHSRRGVTLSD